MLGLSPPSRAAWIEIRNTPFEYDELASPPSRAAWIEMFLGGNTIYSDKVAAFTGGVD